MKWHAEILVEIYRDGKLLIPLQVEKQYQEWILQMHDTYDQEIDCGGDQPLLIVGPSNKKKLGISSDGKLIKTECDVSNSCNHRILFLIFQFMQYLFFFG